MPNLLPPDLMELQLSQIDLLLAMYPEDTRLEAGAENVRESLARWTEGLSPMPERVPPTITISLDLDLSSEIGKDVGTRSISLELVVSLDYDGPEPPAEPPLVRVRVKQPTWMNKAEVADLQAGIPDEEDMLSTIEHVREACFKHIEKNQASISSLNIDSDAAAAAEPFVRVWFYFPSISTRSKRDDLINHGPSYGLSGFLMAGKPGILCLEGGSRSIDEYMKFIKTDSWGDIPAHHKKVSERHRETGDGVQQVFAGMQEITDLLGERRGERANRNDMKAVETWLEDRGLDDAFKKVLM